MAKPVFTTSDLSRKSGDIIAEAMRQPVTITQRNKPRLVLLNVEDYERLREYADHRQVLTPDTIDEELMAKIEKAVEEYANEPDE
jgi:prevent-host-death family protein